MPRYKLTIAYDGTNYCGWQKQEPFAHVAAGTHADSKEHAQGQNAPAKDTPTALPPVSPLAPPEKIVSELALREGEDRPRVALRTVQHVVEQAVMQVVRERVVLDGASRTDAGVHARGQVAAFSCSTGEVHAGEQIDAISRESGHTGWPVSRGVERLVRAINGKLPDDVVVMGAQVVHDDFDPVRGATSKAYSYTIHNARERALWDRHYVHHVYEPLDVHAMRQAAAHFVGEHDFVAFATANHGRMTTVRTVFMCDVSATGLSARSADANAQVDPMPQRVRIDISGSGFLYNMVRIISGTLVEVGRGRMHPDAIPAILSGKDRRAAGPTLPGRGLCLEWVKYEASASW